MAGRIMQNLPNMGRSLLMVRVIPSEEEGRRCLMMEQEEKGLKPADENAPGAIDITAINSPVSAHSSGYSSADDENLISPNNSSQFSPFSPDEDFAGISFDAGFSDMVATSDALVQNHTGGVSGGAPIFKEAPLPFSTLSMTPMHNPDFGELIDVDSFLDPLPNFANMSPNNAQPLLAVSSSSASESATVTNSSMSSAVSMAATQPLSVATSPKSTSPLATVVANGLNMNNNFDNDIEMMDTNDAVADTINMSSPGSSVPSTPAAPPSSPVTPGPGADGGPAMSNITINLPPGFNTKGQDGKSVLLDLLRKADKSQLLKIHEQINAAMATISQSKSTGKSIPTPELQISITPASTKSQFNIQTSTSIPKSIPSPNHPTYNQSLCQSSSMSTSPILSMMNNNKNSIAKSPNVSNSNGIVSPGGNGLVGGCANSVSSRASTPMDIAGTNLDTISSLFGDLESQIPQGFDLGLDSTPTNGNGFSDGLLNDVNLGVTAPMLMSPPNTQTHVSKVPASQTNRGDSSHISNGTPLVIATSKPSVSKTRSFNDTYARQQQAKALSPISPNKCLLQRQQSNGHPQQRNYVSYNGQNSASSPDQSFDLAAAMRGLDDHSYTSKCPSQRKNNEHVKFAPLAETKAGRMKNAPVLEHLLTTKKPLNPMKGSDHVAHGLQQLALNDMEARNGLNQPNLLKKLLTGEMDKNQLQRTSNASIYTRRGGNHHISISSASAASSSRANSNSVLGTPRVSASTSSSSSAAGSRSQLVASQSRSQPATASQPQNIKSNTVGGITIDTDFGFDEAAMLGSLDLLGPDAGVEMDSLWSTTPKDSTSGWNTSAKSDNEEIFGDIDELLQGETQSEIDDILRQETHHEDEWMKQFLDGIL